MKYLNLGQPVGALDDGRTCPRAARTIFIQIKQLRARFSGGGGYILLIIFSLNETNLIRLNTYHETKEKIGPFK